MNKKILLIGLAVTALLTFSGCGQETASEAPTEAPVTEEMAEVVTETTEAGQALSFEGIAEKPILVTSFGQSADVAMLKALFKKIDVEITFDPVVKAEDLGEAKTLFIAAGASTKGLGAAGIKPEEELERAGAIVTAAKEKGMTIIVVHLGGSARRGDLSDDFIELATKEAGGLIVVAEGNQDGYFTGVSEEKSIPFAEVESIAKAVEPLTEMFGAN